MLKKKSPDKLVALTECGNVAKISAQWRGGSKWLYFAPWYDYERTNNPDSQEFLSTEHTHANAAWWEDAFAQDYVLTRDAFKEIMTGVQAAMAADPEGLQREGRDIIARGKGFLYIYNLSGQLVRQHMLSDQNHRYHLTGLPHGTYIITVGEKTLKVKL